MNETQYVNAITRRIRCSRSKKKEIKKQLAADIALRTRQGESAKDIISQMGNITEVADSFNETIPAREQKLYSRNKLLKILFSITLALILLVMAVYWMLPKGNDIADSKYFSQTQVEAAMKHAVELLDAGDYAALRETAITQMQSVLTKESMGQVKDGLSDDWGGRKQFGTAYIAELVQKNAHFAVGEITVTYENISVTYRLTFDQDMRLAGLYIR